MAVASAGPYASLHLAPDRQPRQHPTTRFLRAGCPSCRPTNSIKALKALVSPGKRADKWVCVSVPCPDCQMTKWRCHFNITLGARNIGDLVDVNAPMWTSLHAAHFDHQHYCCTFRPLQNLLLCSRLVDVSHTGIILH